MHRWSTTWLLLAMVILSGLLGCADGPFNGGGTLNPWLRREWDKDERRGPTFHTQMQQLKQLADSASYEPADRQEQIAQEMMERYRNEPNPLLRGAVIKVVGYVNGSVVDETLAAAMKDSEPEVRIAAAKALGRRGNEEALRVLSSSMAEDTDLDVRIAIAGELKRFRNSQEATRALALALEENDAGLQHQAIVSLEQVTGRSYGMNASSWREYLSGGNPAPPPETSLADRVKGWIWW